MRFLLILFISVLSLNLSFADMPGSATFGTPTRVNGRIVNMPNNSNPRPYYSQGNLVYPYQTGPYRNSSGRISYGTGYQTYPYRSTTVNYSWERQRLNDLNNAQNQAYYQGNYNNQPYNRYQNQGYQGYQQGYQGYNTVNPGYNPVNPGYNQVNPGGNPQNYQQNNQQGY